MSTVPHIAIYADRSLKNIVCQNSQCATSLKPVARQLYQTALGVYDFFLQTFGIDGVDGQGTVPPFIIGWDKRNAAWTCTVDDAGRNCALQFNDGLAARPEVVCHEYTHGVLDNGTLLGRVGMAGALHEVMGDAMGIAFKHKTTSDQDWTIGTFRDLSIYFDMRSFNKNGDVHDNARIPGHAFFQAVQAIRGKSYGVIAQIWMRAALLTIPNETFSSFAIKTIDKAKMYSETATRAVVRSWVLVGVLVIQVPREPRRPNPQALRFQSVTSHR